MAEPAPVRERIYVTRPVLPTIEQVTAKLQDIWNLVLERELAEFLKVPQLSNSQRRENYQHCEGRRQGRVADWLNSNRSAKEST